jgi:hypothetical protein
LLVVIFFTSYFIKDIKWSIRIWFLSIAICAFAGHSIDGFIQTHLANVIEDARLEQRDAILNAVRQEVLDRIGFRLDFILYSAAAIFLGWYYLEKKNFNQKFYIQLFNAYVLTNAVWIAFFMYTPHTNRYAYISWSIMPIVMVYPLLKENLIKNKYRFIGYLALGSLLFNWFMFLK